MRTGVIQNTEKLEVVNNKTPKEYPRHSGERIKVRGRNKSGHTEIVIPFH
jgi:hypothetical protein